MSAGCGGLACTRNSDCPKGLTCSDLGRCATPPPAQPSDSDGGAGDGGSESGSSGDTAAEELEKLLGL